jgi:hypothetical protein
MMAAARDAIIVLFGSVMVASSGCGGRSGMAKNADATPSRPDANVSPADGDTYGGSGDALGLPDSRNADSDQAGDGSGGSIEAGSDGDDVQASRSCFQAHRQSAPCPSSEWYAFQGDTRCFLCANSAEPGCSSNVRYTCGSWGDGLCYRLCESNADCTDPCFPYCRKLSLYGGSEYCGTSSKSVCLRANQDTCDPSDQQL